MIFQIDVYQYYNTIHVKNLLCKKLFIKLYFNSFLIINIYEV